MAPYTESPLGDVILLPIFNISISVSFKIIDMEDRQAPIVTSVIGSTVIDTVLYVIRLDMVANRVP